MENCCLPARVLDTIFIYMCVQLIVSVQTCCWGITKGSFWHQEKGFKKESLRSLKKKLLSKKLDKKKA